MHDLTLIEQATGLVFEAPLGRGGFGTVYRARHPALDVKVAVKLLPVLDLNSSSIDRLLKEARLLARLDHPNLLRVLDAGQAAGAIYLVTELMDGGDCSKFRCLGTDAAISFARQLLSAVQALHDSKILHRDVKPANCLVREHDNRIKLADLGISIAWQSHQDAGFGGTIPYMAPELFSDPPKFSRRSDLYAAGLTLASVLLDEPPFPQGSQADLRAWILSGERPRITRRRPDLPASFSQTIERLMSPAPNDRPPTAAAALASMSDGAATAATAEFSSLSSGNLHSHRSPSHCVGPWILGAPTYSSSNWDGFTVTHEFSGKAGRLLRMREGSPLQRLCARMIESARVSARLEHSCIVRTLDWGTISDRPFIVTEAHGCTLQQLVQTRGLNEHIALPFLIALAEGLDHLHDHGWIYQHLDPGAAVISYNGRSALLAWPAYLARSGSTLHESGRVYSKAFAAPEMIAGRAPLAPSSDVFSLGAVGSCLLAGRAEYLASRRQGRFPDLREISRSTTAPTLELLESLVVAAPDQRPTAATVAKELRRQGDRLGISTAERAPQSREPRSAH